jgi:hypothetical protein
MLQTTISTLQTGQLLNTGQYCQVLLLSLAVYSVLVHVCLASTCVVKQCVVCACHACAIAECSTHKRMVSHCLSKAAAAATVGASIILLPYASNQRHFYNVYAICSIRRPLLVRTTNAHLTLCFDSHNC